MSVQKTEYFDFIVVGSGAGGGTVAARLSEDERCKVLLLEAGVDYPHEDPPEFASPMGGEWHPELDWGYLAEASPGGRQLPLPRGKVVGGSTTINGCVWVRGRPSDFDRWAAMGADGWGWNDVLPYIEAVERTVPSMTCPQESWLPIERTLAEATLEFGFRWTDNLNGPDAWDGVVGLWPRNIRNGIRQGSLVTYIRAARGRPNFTLRDRAHVDRVLVERGRARGVAYLDADGRARTVAAGHVVLSAGAYGSAPILLRSGIGPSAALREQGIDIIEDLPVGTRLLEHAYVFFPIRTSPAHARNGQWANGAARGDGWFAFAVPFDQAEGTSAIGFGLATHDTPQGTIALASTDPRNPPRINHRYWDLVTDGRIEPLLETFHELLRTPAYVAVGARDVREGMPIVERLRDGITGNQPAGGCAIGSVVDTNLSVYGIDGVTVADASVFPAHVSNNPNLTCFMVGEAAGARMTSRLDTGNRHGRASGTPADDPPAETAAK